MLAHTRAPLHWFPRIALHDFINVPWFLEYFGIWCACVCVCVGVYPNFVSFANVTMVFGSRLYFINGYRCHLTFTLCLILFHLRHNWFFLVQMKWDGNWSSLIIPMRMRMSEWVNEWSNTQMPCVSMWVCVCKHNFPVNHVQLDSVLSSLWYLEVLFLV